MPLIIQVNIMENLLGQPMTFIDTTNLTANELEAILEELNERTVDLRQQVQQQQAQQQQQQQQQQRQAQGQQQQGQQQGQGQRQQQQQGQQGQQGQQQNLPPFIDRDLSYTRIARDGTTIYHFIRELTLDQEISKEDLIGYSRGFAEYIHPDLNRSLINKQFFKFYVNLVSESGLGVSASMSNGFIPARMLTVAEIQELLIESAEKLTSGQNVLIITFNTTSI
jgi:DNA primase